MPHFPSGHVNICYSPVAFMAPNQLADLDQGATENFPIDGYVATQAWAEKYPKTAAAFVSAVQEGQTIAETKPLIEKITRTRSFIPNGPWLLPSGYASNPFAKEKERV
jgi:hypothetical protein